MELEDETIEGRYSLVDNLTGEVIPAHHLYTQVKAGYWEKAFAKSIAEFFEISGCTATLVLTYILKNKDARNRIAATHKSIADEIGSSERSVATVFKKLQASDFLRKMRNGLYMLSPDIMRHGNKIRGVVMFKDWGRIGETDES